MKVAVLILSHRAPAALPLHAAYWGDTGDLFIHVDRKVPQEKIPTVDSAYFIPRREIFWGGWAMVQSTFDLIQTARAKGDYARYILISDDSAPLLPLADMLSLLSDQTREYIWASENASEKLLDRYNYFYWFDHPAVSPNHVNHSLRRIDDELLLAIEDLRRLRERGKKPVQLRHGDQWWGLSAATIAHVCHIYASDHWLRESFRFSSIPDEQYIQTIIPHPWKEKCMLSERRPTHMPPQNVHRSADSLRASLQPDYLFVRKVDPAIPELAELIRTGLVNR